MADVTTGPIDPWTQLMLLKEQTRRFACLHEAQVVQLKVYPLICFDALPENVYMEADIEGHALHFHIGLERLYSRAEAHRMSLILNTETKNLLGTEWEISVSLSQENGKRMKFRFKREENGVRTAEERKNRPDASDSQGRVGAPHGGEGQ